MTRLLLITLLLLSSAPAFAEWVAIGITTDGVMTTYVDPDTIRRKGNLVKMWHLFDYKTIETEVGHSFLSSEGLSEFDCAEERSRVLAFTHFSGNMGSGKVVYYESGEHKWEPVAPRSGFHGMWKVACAEK